MQNSLGAQDFYYTSKSSGVQWSEVLPQEQIQKCLLEEKKSKIVPQCTISLRTDLPPLRSLDSAQGWSNLFKSVRPVSLNLNQRTQSIDDIINLCHSIPSAKGPVETFLKLKAQNQLRVEFVTADMMEQSSWGAQYDFEKKVIYLNMARDLGTLAPAFIHELTHALDPNLGKGGAACKVLEADPGNCHAKILSHAKTLRKEQQEEMLQEVDYICKRKAADAEKCMNPVVFKTERLAYDAQLKFINEMSQNYPCYHGYITAQSKNEEIISTYMTNTQIVKKYGLDDYSLLKSFGENLFDDETKVMGRLKNFPALPESSTRIDYYACLDRFIESHPNYKKNYDLMRKNCLPNPGQLPDLEDLKDALFRYSRKKK
jgi:hypothetical protein